MLWEMTLCLDPKVNSSCHILHKLLKKGHPTVSLLKRSHPLWLCLELRQVVFFPLRVVSFEKILKAGLFHKLRVGIKDRFSVLLQFVAETRFAVVVHVIESWFSMALRCRKGQVRDWRLSKRKRWQLLLKLLSLVLLLYLVALWWEGLWESLRGS